MGDNWWGQLGIRKNVGIILDEYVTDPTPVVDENLVGRKIVDFDLGSNSLLILTGSLLGFRGKAMPFCRRQQGLLLGAETDLQADSLETARERQGQKTGRLA